VWKRHYSKRSGSRERPHQRQDSQVDNVRTPTRTCVKKTLATPTRTCVKKSRVIRRSPCRREVVCCDAVADEVDVLSPRHGQREGEGCSSGAEDWDPCDRRQLG
jgi:hypothetical protein